MTGSDGRLPVASREGVRRAADRPGGTGHRPLAARSPGADTTPEENLS
ncbi:hypothetical protein [Streptomyces broussonetiae]|uniref:Uncharacterized protein n=1 Tax=Streptomyces broussonetiae TaxID=2686304 RepID=A0ABV5EGZ8_9ACTN